MAYTLIWSDDAQENIRQIIAYLLEYWGDAVAERFSDRLVSAGGQLEQLPYSGMRHRQLSAVRELRILPYYTVFYTVVESKKELFVLNVQDQRMNWSASK